jgi:hypothetical protein
VRIATTRNPRRTWAAAVALPVVACLACVLPGPALRPDRVLAEPRPAPWKRIAVLPFGGAPDLRRPASELLALRLREQDRVAVMPPLAVDRLLERSPVAGGAGAERPWEAWVAACAAAEAPLAPGASRPPPADVRALAAALGADALVAATVVHSRTWRVRLLQLGAVVDLVLLDGASGEPVAVLRRRGDSSAASWGAHELAMDAANRAGSDLLRLLGTVPGRLAPPPPPEPAPMPE